MPSCQRAEFPYEDRVQTAVQFNCAAHRCSSPSQASLCLYVLLKFKKSRADKIDSTPIIFQPKSREHIYVGTRGLSNLRTPWSSAINGLQWSATSGFQAGCVFEPLILKTIIRQGYVFATANIFAWFNDCGKIACYLMLGSCIAL
jgi:hypothetical protein